MGLKLGSDAMSFSAHGLVINPGEWRPRGTLSSPPSHGWQMRNSAGRSAGSWLGVAGTDDDANPEDAEEEAEDDVSSSRFRLLSWATL